MRTFLTITCAVMLITAPSVLQADRRLEQERWAYYQESAELTRPDLVMIWDELIPPREAAKSLIRGLNFTLIPNSFNRKLHHLHYQLGHLAHDRRARWSPELVEVCCRLERYIALFTMLEGLPLNSPFPVRLLGMTAANVMPETDCIPEMRTSARPVWQAARGRKFSAALFALPDRIMKQVSITAHRLVNIMGKSCGVQPELYAVSYKLHDRQWQSTQTSAGSLDLGNGLQVCRLLIDIPPDLPAGKYFGTVRAAAPDRRDASVLHYELNIKP